MDIIKKRSPEAPREMIVLVLEALDQYTLITIFSVAYLGY